MKIAEPTEDGDYLFIEEDRYRFVRVLNGEAVTLEEQAIGAARARILSSSSTANGNLLASLERRYGRQPMKKHSPGYSFKGQAFTMYRINRNDPLDRPKICIVMSVSGDTLTYQHFVGHQWVEEQISRNTLLSGVCRETIDVSSRLLRWANQTKETE